jgi:hypothetical protein
VSKLLMCYYGTFHQRREEGLWKHWANERAIVGTSGGRFSLFFWGENRPVRVLSWCYENLIGSLMYIYIYIFWAGEDWSGYQNFILKNLPGSQIGWFSYIPTTGSHNLVIKFFIN